MSRVYGSKVKEPVKINCPSPQKGNESTGKLSGLLEAWSSFGDVNSKLQDLEERARGAVLLEERSKPKRHVSKTVSTDPYIIRHHRDEKDPQKKKATGVLKGNEKTRVNKRQGDEPLENANDSSVVVEGSVLNSGSLLNETFTVSPDHQPQTPQDGDGGEGEGENGRHDVETPAKNVQQQQVTSNIKEDVSMTEWPVMNTAAVFGPPGNFKVPTGQSAGNQPPSAGHQSKSSSDAEHVPNVPHVSKSKSYHTRKSSAPIYPQRAPLREFVLPPHEALSSLQARLDQQQQAVRRTAAVVNDLLHQPPIYPIVPPGRNTDPSVEGGTSSSSALERDHGISDSSPPRKVVRKVVRSPKRQLTRTSPERHSIIPHGTGIQEVDDFDPFVAYSRHFGQDPSLHLPTSLPQSTIVDPSLDPRIPRSSEPWNPEDLGVRKRKVANVPPPQQPRFGVVEKRPPVNKLTSTVHSEHQPEDGLHQHRNLQWKNPSKTTVRKVSAPQRTRVGGDHTRVSTKGAHIPLSPKRDKGSSTITPFSWREGEELSKRVLAALKETEQTDRRTKLPSKTVPGSDPLNSSTTSTSTHQQVSGTSSTTQVPVALEVHVPCGGQDKLDVERLLEDLESSPGGRRGVSDKRSSSPPEKRKLKKPSSSPAKKLKVTTGMLYNVPKQRHYDADEVRLYMQKQKEERRRKQLESKQAAQRDRELKKQRLQELYDVQRNQLGHNLAKVYSRRQQADHTFQKPTGASVHLHLDESNDTETDSDFQTVRKMEWERASDRNDVEEQTYFSPSHNFSKQPQRRQSPITTRTRNSHNVLDSSPPSNLPHTSPPLTSQGIPTAFSPRTSGNFSTRGVPEEEPLPLSPTSRQKKKRLQALLISAQALKTRIAIEKNKLLDPVDRGWLPSGTPPCSSPQRMHGSSVAGVPHRSFASVHAQPSVLPGVGNMDVHVQTMDELHTQTKAAAAIQAAYRGHVVRKHLSAVGLWPKKSKVQTTQLVTPREQTTQLVTPREQTTQLVAPREQTTQLVTPREQTTQLVTSRQQTTQLVTPREQTTQLATTKGREIFSAESPHVSPTKSQLPRSMDNTKAPILGSKQADLESEDLHPWEKRGGDKHSIVNIYARKHSKRHQPPSADVRSSTPKEDVPVTRTATLPTSYSGEPFDSLTPTEDGSEEEGMGHDSQLEQEQTTPVMSPLGLPSGTHPISGHHLSSVSGSVEQSVSLRSNPSSATQHTTASHQTYSENFESEVLSVQKDHQTLEPDSLGDDEFVESQDKTFLNSSTPPRSRHAMKEAEVQTGPAGASPIWKERLSPHALQVKLSNEISRLEAADEEIRRLSEMEREKAIRKEQTEVVSLTHLLKSTHEQEMQRLSEKAQRDLDEMKKQLSSVQTEASLAAERVSQLEKDAREKATIHAQFMAKLEEEARESQQRLAEARREASEAVIQAARKQMENAHNLATQTAISAAKAAVKAVLQKQSREDSHSTASAFEDVSSLTSTKDSEDTTIKDREGTSGEQVSTEVDTSILEDKDTGTDGTDDDTAQTLTGTEEISEDLNSTLVAVEEDTVDPTPSGQHGKVDQVQTQTPSHTQQHIPHMSSVTTGDDDKEIFRKVLPSESHRRRQRRGKTPPRLSIASFSSDMMSSVSSLHDDLSPLEQTRWSPLPANEHVESFDNFTLRIIDQFVKDQEARAKHQRTLLKLRERALEERTRAKLRVLEQWRKRIEKKGSDEKMPALLRKEKGLLQKYKNEKAELQSLQEAQKREREERRLLLLQQKEIGKLHLSTQAYLSKAKKLEEGDDNISLSISSLSPVSLVGESPSATPLVPLSESTPSVRVDASSGMTPSSVSEEARESATTPQETSTSRLSDQVSSVVEVKIHRSSPGTSQQSPGTHPVESVVSPLKSVEEESVALGSETKRLTFMEDDTAPQSGLKDALGRSEITTVNSPSLSPSTNYVTQRLGELEDYSNSERKLAEKEERLLHQRTLAEQALLAQEKLLEREKKLKLTQAEITLLLNEADEIRNKRLEVSQSTPVRPEQQGLPSQGVNPGRTEPEKTRGFDQNPSEPTSDHSRPTVLHTTVGITEDLSSITREDSAMLEVPTEGSVRYGQDTFESIGTVTGVLTSTPQPPSRIQLHSAREDHSPTSTDITTISTTTTESTEIETRIKRLREDVRQRKEEIKHAQQEQKRKKRALLQEKEEQLKNKLRALEEKFQGAKQTFSRVVSSDVLLHSATTTASESEGEYDKRLPSESAVPPLVSSGSDTVVHTPVEANPLLSYTPFSDEVTVPGEVRTATREDQGSIPQEDQSTLVEVPEVDDVLQPPIQTSMPEGFPNSHSSPQEVFSEVKEESNVAGSSTILTDLAQESSLSVQSEGREPQSSVEDVSSSLKSTRSSRRDKTHSRSATNLQEGIKTDKENITDVSIGETPLEDLSATAKSPKEGSSLDKTITAISNTSPHSPRRNASSSKSSKITSPKSSPSRIPIFKRSRSSASSQHSPPSSRGNQQVKSSPLLKDKPASDQEDTLKDISNYSETFTEVSQSTSIASGSTTRLGSQTRSEPLQRPEDISGGGSRKVEGEDSVGEVPTDVEESVPEESTGVPTVEANVGAGRAVSEDELAPPVATVLNVEGSNREPVDLETRIQLEPPQATDVISQLAEVFEVGQRVVVGNAVSGVVRFIGPVHFAQGTFVGVELDLPKGNHNGRIQDVQYFDCPENCGLFAPPSKVSLLEEDQERTGLLGVTSSDEEDNLLFGRESQTPDELKHLTDEDMEQKVKDGSVSETESPTPSEISSVDSEEVPPLTQEQEAVLSPSPDRSLVRGGVVEDDQGAVRSGGDVRRKLDKVNHVAEGLMNHLMSELVVDLSAAKKKKAAQQFEEVHEKNRVLAENITNELLSLYLQSEIHLLCNLRSAKLSAAIEEEQTSRFTPQRAVEDTRPGHLPLMATNSTQVSATVPSGVLHHRLSPEPPNLPISPPSSPPGSPGSPPRYSARAVAGDRSPPSPSPDTSHHSHTSAVPVAKPRVSLSSESLSSLLAEPQFTDAELSLLPRDKANVDRVTEHAWNDFHNAVRSGADPLELPTPEAVILIRPSVRQPSHLITRDERICRVSFLHLVYQLALEVMQENFPRPLERVSPVCLFSPPTKKVRKKVSTTLESPPTLEAIQQQVFLRLIEGRLPIRLPKGRFHHGNRRPGGREVDFLESLLIKELRAEGRSWAEFDSDEYHIKIQTADNILDSLIIDTVKEVKRIQLKKSLVTVT